MPAESAALELHRGGCIRMIMVQPELSALHQALRDSKYGCHEVLKSAANAMKHSTNMQVRTHPSHAYHVLLQVQGLTV